MAKDELTGNMPTENIVDYFYRHGVTSGLNVQALREAEKITGEIFL
jgi:hydroxymethylglutaryl-CoA lyase